MRNFTAYLHNSEEVAANVNKGFETIPDLSLRVPTLDQFLKSFDFLKDFNSKNQSWGNAAGKQKDT
jgi:hypothetical protein